VVRARFLHHPACGRNRRVKSRLVILLGATAACVPSGNAPPYDAGTTATTASPTFRPSFNVITEPFEDNFDRPDAAAEHDAGHEAGVAEAGAEAGSAAEAEAPASPSNLGPNWLQAKTNAWHVENGRLCGMGAHNHPVWLNKTLPVNARIEFDAVSYSDDGDLKAEVWGDGRSFATSTSYTNATSYLAILGGWHNTLHVLARINEHGNDRKELPIDKTSDDPRQRPVVRGQTYRFKVERTDGKTVHFFVDGLELHKWTDPSPLVGAGHDHFGFNEWEAKVCFDNVKVTPLP
jgi:hypothetical protein